MLKAASEAFRSKGFHATSMKDIAAALGMTAGNLYYYFPSKQGLLAFCQDDTLNRLLATARWARKLTLPPDQQLFLAIQGHVVSLNESVPGSLAHLEIEHLPEVDRARCIARRDRYERQLRAMVADGAAAGVFRPVDPKVAVLTVLGALNWTVRWYRPGGGRQTPQGLGREMAEHLVRGLLAPGRALAVPDLDIPTFDSEVPEAAEDRP